MFFFYTNTNKCQKGLTLTEVVVSLFLLTITVGAIYTAFVVSNSSFRTHAIHEEAIYLGNKLMEEIITYPVMDPDDDRDDPADDHTVEGTIPFAELPGLNYSEYATGPVSFTISSGTLGVNEMLLCPEPTDFGFEDSNGNGSFDSGETIFINRDDLDDWNGFTKTEHVGNIPVDLEVHVRGKLKDGTDVGDVLPPSGFTSTFKKIYFMEVVVKIKYTNKNRTYTDYLISGRKNEIASLLP